MRALLILAALAASVPASAQVNWGLADTSGSRSDYFAQLQQRQYQQQQLELQRQQLELQRRAYQDQQLRDSQNNWRRQNSYCSPLTLGC